ncbi:MAG: NAD(P)/FAD-dependent oxidoreductase, partial [Thermoanaerobaculia bacterium]
MHHAVIIGAGFGGLYAARAMRRMPVRVTVIDRRNHHLFQPLLYQVATAALNPSDIAAPIRAILRKQTNTTVVLGDVERIDRASKCVHLRDGTSIIYDSLIIATGATHSYFGRDDWATHAPGLKTIEDALEIRRRILLAYEAAERELDAAKRAALMTFVIVGAGPTGVELAGALAEIARHALQRDFRRIDTRTTRVVLLEGLGQVLPSYPPQLGASALRQLEKLGVEVRTGARVTEIDDEGVSIGDERIPTRTVLWAAGVKASDVLRSLDAPLDKAGRVLVDPCLNVPGDRSVFVIGDAAAATQPDGTPVPGVAPAAMQQGRHAAKMVKRSLL